jgi:beta-phosphoglucomutase-like phosphatase (HAD superfamily)
MPNAIPRDRYDAVLLDLDGVITDTATIHATCWKQMFDAYLRQRAAARGEPFHPFEIATDYRRYVDGKPRFDGVRDFLASRGIQLPEGSPDDSPQADTVGGLGNRKNDLVNTVITAGGVHPYAGSVTLIQQLRQQGFQLAVVTSSQTHHLAGKPAPDTFLLAAQLLGVAPARAVVIEDALAGVQARRNGHFGLVIGVARQGNAAELRQHGAHRVVADLGELVD